MPRPSLTAAAVRDTADAQFGLITAAQLTALGAHRSTASRRATGGMWTRVLPGVHLVGGGVPSRLQRLMAALLYAGPHSVLTGTSGLRVHGFRSIGLAESRDDAAERPEPVHVLVPHDVRRLSTGFVRVERTRRAPRTQRIDGLEIADVPRCVGDAARRLPRETDVVAISAEAIQRGRCTWEQLRSELDDGPMRGSAHLRAALTALRSGAHSVPEADVAGLLEGAGVPAVMLNVRLVTAGGVFVAVADVWLDDVGLAVEIDSVTHHAGAEGFARTVRRNSRYASAGVLVVTVLPADVRDRPRWVLDQILRARLEAAARPRPAVHAVRDGEASAGIAAWPWGA